MWIKELLMRIVYRLRGLQTTNALIKKGLTVGVNFNRMHDVLIDDSHCWLIRIGDNVTLAPRVSVLAHDASTKMLIGYTKIGTVKIGNNVFVGANSVILPGTIIGDNVVIGVGSIVCGNIPSGGVYAGNPCKMLCTTESYIAKHKERMQAAPVYGQDYTLSSGVTEDKKIEMKTQMENTVFGYVR